MDWGTWVQQVAGGAIDRYTNIKQQEAYQDTMRLQALGSQGYYVEGQRGLVSPVAGTVTMSTSMLMLIGAVVLVMVVAD